MQKQAIINQIEILDDGAVAVRIRKQIVDSAEIYHLGWHRVMLAKETDVPMAIAAVNTHLIEMGFKPMTDADALRIANYAAIARQEVTK